MVMRGVTVSQEGLEISISSHIILENQLRNKLKNDRLHYKATVLDESANSSTEQSIVGGSPSSGHKDNTLFSTIQDDEGGMSVGEAGAGYGRRLDLGAVAAQDAVDIGPHYRESQEIRLNSNGPLGADGL